MTLARCAVVLSFAVALAGCNPPPPPAQPGVNRLVPFPEGTADTTYGAVGVQTSPH